MMRQFWCELFVGTIALGAMIMYGPRGAAAIALLTFMPLVLRNQKADEREYFLFYKTANYTMALFIIALVIINQLQFYTDSAMIKKDWLSLGTAAFLMIHGLTGIIVFKTH